MINSLNIFCQYHCNAMSVALEKIHMDIKLENFKKKIVESVASSYISKEQVVLGDVLKIHVEHKRLSFNSFLRDEELGSQEANGYNFKANQYPPKSNKRNSATVMVTSSWDEKILNNAYCTYLTSSLNLIKHAFFVFVITKVKNPQTGKYNRVLNVVVQDLQGCSKDRLDIVHTHFIAYLQYLRKVCGIKYVRFNNSENIEIALGDGMEHP